MTSKIKRWVRPWIGPLREFREFRSRPRPLPLDIATPGGGHIDALLVHADNTVAAYGSAVDLEAAAGSLSLRVDGRTIPPAHAFRVPRPDLDRPGPDLPMRGAVIEWALAPGAAARSAALLVEGRPVAETTSPAAPEPPYGHLRTSPRALGRDEIYGHGTPVPFVSAEVLQLARALPPPILDFGCGGGALVAALRAEGLEAVGLELDEPRIRDHLLPAARPHVTLYDGRLPAPFPDRGFASVVCSEVLEHIAGPERAVAELARLATRRMLVTVPDLSAIPRGHQHGVVPWHLLEATHVNFYSQHSLERALAPYAARIEMARLGRVQCDRLTFYTTLAAVVVPAGAGAER